QPAHTCLDISASPPQGRYHLPTSVEAAMAADPMRHYRLATVGANRWTDWHQRIVSTTLVLLGMRGASFGSRYAHARLLAQNPLHGFVRVCCPAAGPKRTKPLSDTNPATARARRHIWGEVGRLCRAVQRRRIMAHKDQLTP